jgi:ferredoxin
MHFSIRDGKFDVVILGGPRTDIWPSPGIRVLSTLCAEMGLTVGQFGGESMTVRGVMALPGTGGIAIIEDNQHRIHRIRARAIVRIVPESYLPDPFPGWYSSGLIPLSTAERLFRESEVLWDPSTVILGTGNQALQFGTSLLESGIPEVYCIETYAKWGKKRFSGWEVHQRQFEMNGGKIFEAQPLELINKGPLRWLLRVKDSQGIRVMEVARVVSAGPFRVQSGIREHPPGSFLYELDQTASQQLAQDVEGWLLEEERGRWLAGKIVRALATDLSKRDELDRTFRRAKTKLKHYFEHRNMPHTPSYQGKWLSIGQTNQLRAFGGIPKKLHQERPIASVECFEEISCQICQKVCPTSAIQISSVARKKNVILDESACTACGLCIRSCPTASIPLLREDSTKSTSQITLPWRGRHIWQAGESATLLNRRGETLGSARISKVDPDTSRSSPTPERQESSPTSTLSSTLFSEKPSRSNETVQLVQLEIPSHLIWEVRAIKRSRPTVTEDEAYLAAVDRSSTRAEKVEVLLNGEKRWVRDRISISVALFEIGQTRPTDLLICKDGSCGLCQISVDGISKLACQTKIHKGMSIRMTETEKNSAKNPTSALCPCLGVTQEQVIERLKQGQIHSPEAARSITHVGEGKCHGQLCMPAFIRVLMDQGLPVSQWIDWRFPWSDWVVKGN